MKGLEQEAITTITSVTTIDSMSSSTRYTTIPVRRETRNRLRGYKVGGVTYDDLINDLLDMYPPGEFFLKHLGRLHVERRHRWANIKEELDL